MNSNENVADCMDISQLIADIEEKDLFNTQKNVLDCLGTIRIAKKKLLEQMKLLMEKEIEDTLIQRLIQSYDGLRTQEDEFFSAFQKIINNCFSILDNAYLKLSLLPNKKNETEEDGSSMDEGEENNEKIKLDNCKTMVEGVNNLFKEALEASNLLDQQLKMRLEIHFELKKKKNILTQMQKKIQCSKNEENAMNQCEITTNSTDDRKQRQLERLRKEAARRGIISNKTNTKQKSIEENKLSSTGDLNFGETILPPPVTELPELSEGTSNDVDLHAKILERFNSLQNRRQRMQNVRSKLETVQRQKMDNTYEEAIKRFNNLSEMRSKLEELQNVCSEVVEENDRKEKKENTQSQLMEKCEFKNRSLEDPNDSSVEDNHSSVSTNELLNEVRRAFNTAFKKEKSGGIASMDSQTTGNIPCGSSSFESAFSTLSDRLKVIENVLHTHTDQLVWIGNQINSLTDLIELHVRNTTLTQSNSNLQFSTASTATIVPNVSSPTQLSSLLSIPSTQQHSISLQQMQFASVLKRALISVNPDLFHQIFMQLKNIQAIGGADHELLDSLIQRLILSPNTPSTSFLLETPNFDEIKNSQQNKIESTHHQPSSTSIPPSIYLSPSVDYNLCTGEGNEEGQQQLKNESMVEEKNEEKNRNNAKMLTARLVTNLFQGQCGVDKTKKIDGEFISSVIHRLVIESCAICPPESHEKIKESFPTILDEVMSPYLNKEFWQIVQILTKELSEALESEITFIFLIHNANALTI